MWNQPTYPMMWHNISEDLSLQQYCSEEFESLKLTTILNIHEASDDLVEEHVELKILIKTISFY
jgi:hypothetical protein